MTDSAKCMKHYETFYIFLSIISMYLRYMGILPFCCSLDAKKCCTLWTMSSQSSIFRIYIYVSLEMTVYVHIYTYKYDDGMNIHLHT